MPGLSQLSREIQRGHWHALSSWNSRWDRCDRECGSELWNAKREAYWTPL